MQAKLINSTPLLIISSVDPSLQARSNSTGPPDLPPKGGVSLHIVDRNHVAYLDYHGIGDETARRKLDLLFAEQDAAFKV